jgi:alkanesulfonate monooxygenase SsuD/methylene tetrahydromethanopterin reductase-like flavin-dependent oxidoreductase (luciferase family)
VAFSPHFGLSLPNRGVLFGATTAAKLVRLAERAEQSGVFGSVWVGDSLLAKPRLEAIALLSGIATRTSRVRLGTVCMASMTLRDPILLAIQWASLDQLAGGRTILGACLGGAGQAMGAGALESEIYGVPNRGRTVRLEEEIALLRRLWLEDDVTFEGQVYRVARVTALPKPIQSPPPIWIATNPKRGVASEAVIEGALARVGRLGDGYMTDAATVEEFAWRWSRVRHHAAAAGRDPDALGACIHLMVNVNPDPAAAFAEADRFLRSYYGVDFGRAYLEVWVASGPPDVVAARVRAYLEAGCTVPILRFASWQQEAQLKAFLAEVAPRLRDLVEPALVAARRR